MAYRPKATFKKCNFLSGHLVRSRFYTWAQNRWPRTEHSTAQQSILDHTGSQAVLLHSTPSTPWLQLLCPVSGVQKCMCLFACLCIRCTEVCLTAAVPTSMRVSGARVTSLLKPLQRDQGETEEVQGARTARTAAAALGFGSWGGRNGVKVGVWKCGVGFVAEGSCKPGGYWVCVWQQCRDRRCGTGGRDVVIVKSWKFCNLCNVCVTPPGQTFCSLVSPRSLKRVCVIQ